MLETFKDVINKDFINSQAKRFITCTYFMTICSLG